MSEHLRVDSQQGGRSSSSASPSPTPSSSPPGSSGYSPSGSSDTSVSPILNRSVRRTSASNHTPAIPRGKEDGSSSDEMNASSDSSCQEFHMDTDKDTHDSLSHCTKPLIEMSSDTGTSELVLDTMKLPSQEESHGQGYKRLEAENRRLRDQIKELKKQLERPSLRERQPLAPINENITDSKMPAKGQAIARHQHMSKENM